MSNANPYEPIPYVKLKHPEWSRNAVIYQINTRQFTEQGTFRAAEKHLPRLKDLGVDILWLMPITLSDNDTCTCLTPTHQGQVRFLKCFSISWQIVRLMQCR